MPKVQKIHKYRILEKIEESNYAIIYRAQADEKKATVLKIARQENPEFNDLISREFQVLSQFQHPNIVPVFDYGVTDDGRAYFTQEYLPDEPINKHFTGYSEEFLAALAQVLNGLGAFHTKGFIHSDLKPEHILYNKEKKKAVLIDFGFARQQLGEGAIDPQELKLAGTIGYIAPEVLKGIGIDQRSDLYSLGIIIYEILSGKRVKDPYVLIKDIPEEINKMVSRLVSKEPALRPSIPELYQTFSRNIKEMKLEVPAYKVTLPQTGFVEPVEIVEKVSATKGTALIIIGDSGAGKTRLLQELKYQYLIKGHSVLFYTSSEKTNFYDALQNFIKLKKTEGIDIENKFQIFEEMNEALLNYAENKNVIIMVDDLDHLSDYELGLFRYLGYGVHNANILLLGAAGSQNKIDTLGFEILPLKPFSYDETQRLLGKTFFKIERLADFAQWLHKQSGGNPLFIVEILKTLYENNVLYFESNQWQIKVDALEETVIPEKLDDLLETRLRELGDEELKILKILSLANHPLEPALVSSLLKTDVSISTEHLKTLRLVREEIINNHRVVTTPNQILNQIIDKNSNAEERRTFSDLLIQSIETVYPDEKDYFPLLARLSEEVGDKEKAYTYFQRAADNAEAIYDYDAALRYYDKLVEYSKDMNTEKYADFLVKIGDLNQSLGNSEQALRFYDNALSTKTGKLAPKIYYSLGRVFYTKSEYNSAVEYLQKAIESMNQKTFEYIKAANHLGYALANLSQFKEAEAMLKKSLALSKELKDVKAEAETLYCQASIEWFKNNIDNGIRIAENLLHICEKNKLSKNYAYCAGLLSSFYQQKGDVRKAQKFLDFAVNAFYKIKHIQAQCTAMSNYALLLTEQGKFSEAQHLYRKTSILAQKIAKKAIYRLALSSIASIGEELGRFDEAIELNRMVLHIDPYYVWSNYNIAITLYKKGMINEAKSLLDRNLKEKEQILYCIGLALVTLAEGHIEKANKLLNKGLNMINRLNPDIYIKNASFMKVVQSYYEMEEYEKSLDFSKKVADLVNPLSKEYSFASAFMKINNFNLKNINELNISQETERLKQIGCIYDYAYLKKVAIESMMRRGVKNEKIKEIAEEVSAIKEIFESLGAGLELNRVKKLQEQLFPMIVKDYSRRIISDDYLKTFSHLAELISGHLGDEDFILNILDLIIKATNAERGAVFMKTTKGMEFLAGRDMDRATIKDASELSKSAIEELEKHRIVFAQDALSDPKFSIKKSVMLNQIRSLLCIPLSVSGNVIGAIYLDSKIASGIFGPQDKDFLFTVSKILASVIEKSMAFQTITEENILLKSNIIKDIGSGYLMGKSRAMKRIYKVIDSVAETNSPVLILGETGTGKGMIARLIHMKSMRCDKKFMSINCGTIPETLLESELFGHKKGAFTGAISDKKGLLEEGEGGIVFLDEISNTSLSFQGKLLEAIEEKIIRRIGETTTRNIDVRFLFATNKDLEIEIEDGRFRSDLFYRINVFKIEVPPLRDRASDIPLLAQFFLDKYSQEMNKKIDGFSPEALQRLRDYLWFGNVRELQNVIERAVVLAKTKLITPQDIGFEKVKTPEILSLKEIRREAIIEALNASRWNVKKAAESLGIGRRTLHRYIKNFNIVKESTITVNRKK